MGCFSMPKGRPNKQYTPELKQRVVEAVVKEGLSYKETARVHEIAEHSRIQSRERIYLAEGSEGLTIECRGEAAKGGRQKK